MIAAEERETREWNRAAAAMALLANINRDTKKRKKPYEVADFHPMLKPRRRGIPLTSQTVQMLKVFLSPQVNHGPAEPQRKPDG